MDTPCCAERVYFVSYGKEGEGGERERKRERWEGGEAAATSSKEMWGPREHRLEAENPLASVEGGSGLGLSLSLFFFFKLTFI